MAIDSPETPKANGLKTAIDIVIAPKEAFESIRVAPTWGWAYLIAIVLVAIGSFLTLPAVEHAIPGDIIKSAATNPQLAQMTPDQLQQVGQKYASFAPFFAISGPFAIMIFALLIAVIMLAFNAIGKGSGGFKTLFASSINIGIIYGLGQVVGGVVVLLRGADSFASVSEVQQAIPSLALLAQGSDVKLHAFLSTLNPFAIWSVVLTALAMTVVARVPRTIAWATAIVVFLLSSGTAVVFAK
jgi:hypothetical protein